ncbi:MAG TPA: SAM-dependent chlorinase/fluorinase [Candidatus Limnocylindrales bacterium]|nr:SAM-dependent chlorinase/fluorinase [Candidatus Limnocylindrales bacterium]
MERPVISFLTDFGPDGPAAICRGVMLGIAREAQILDLAHGVRKYAIADGAYLLESALPYLPVGVHVAVVDPGVGTERRPIAIRAARGDVLVGPDNGLLIPAAEALGGIDEARRLVNRDLMLPATSSTFHGRDIFAPVAAYLATGTPFATVGPVVPAADLVRLALPTAVVRDRGLDTAVIYVDSFGNVRFAATPDELTRAVGVLEAGRPLVVEFASANGAGSTLERTAWQETFGRVPVGRSLLFRDSLGRIALADNQADAAARLGVEVGRAARITGEGNP